MRFRLARRREIDLAREDRPRPVTDQPSRSHSTRPGCVHFLLCTRVSGRSKAAELEHRGGGQNSPTRHSPGLLRGRCVPAGAQFRDERTRPCSSRLSCPGRGTGSKRAALSATFFARSIVRRELLPVGHLALLSRAARGAFRRGRFRRRYRRGPGDGGAPGLIVRALEVGCSPAACCAALSAQAKRRLLQFTFDSRLLRMEL